MSGLDYGRAPRFPGAYGGGSGVSGDLSDLRDGGATPLHSRASFSSDSWEGRERLNEHGWMGPPGEGGAWGPRDAPMMPPGNIITSRGTSLYGEGRGRFGRGPEFAMRGRAFGRSGRGRHSDADFEERGFGGRGPGYGDPQLMRDRFAFSPRGSYRGRGEFGRGRMGRHPGRAAGYEGRGRQEGWNEEGRREPDMDPALLERRRASTAALLKRQVAQLQVSRDLLGEDEAAEVYGRIMESAERDREPDVRTLYTYPLFSAEEMGTVPVTHAPSEEQAQAFELCLQMYQEAQQGHTVVQSEHGNFLMPAR